MQRSLIILILFATLALSLNGQEESAILYFDTDSASLSKSSISTLDQLLKEMPPGESMCWQIIGHTDSTGSSGYNDTLSFERCFSVQQYLQQNGIDTTDMVLSARSFSEPAMPNKTVKGRSKNRRVEIIVSTWEAYLLNDRIPKKVPKTVTFDIRNGLDYTHPSGSHIVINRNSMLDAKNNLVNGTARLEYIEYRDMAEFFISRLPMSFEKDGKTYLYQSGGMFEIRLYVGDKEAFIAPEDIKIDFAKIDSFKDYRLYRFDEPVGEWRFPVNEEIALNGASLTERKDNAVNTIKGNADDEIEEVLDKHNTKYKKEADKTETLPGEEIAKETIDEDDPEDEIGSDLTVPEEEEDDEDEKMKEFYVNCGRTICLAILNSIRIAHAMAHSPDGSLPHQYTFEEQFKRTDYALGVNLKFNEFGPFDQSIKVKSRRKIKRAWHPTRIKYDKTLSPYLVPFKKLRGQILRIGDGSYEKLKQQKVWNDIRIKESTVGHSIYLKDEEKILRYSILFRVNSKKEKRRYDEYKKLLNEIAGVYDDDQYYDSVVNMYKPMLSLSGCWWYHLRNTENFTGDEKQLNHADWLEHFELNKDVNRAKYDSLMAIIDELCKVDLGGGIEDTINPPPPIVDTGTGPADGYCKYFVEDPYLGIYNYDVVVELQDPVTITPTYYTDGKKPVDPKLAFLFDLSLKGLLAVDPKSFEISATSDNILLVFDKYRGVYIMDKERFKKIDLKNDRAPDLFMKNASHDVTNTKELKKAMGLED